MTAATNKSIPRPKNSRSADSKPNRRRPTAAETTTPAPFKAPPRHQEVKDRQEFIHANRIAQGLSPGSRSQKTQPDLVKSKDKAVAKPRANKTKEPKEARDPKTMRETKESRETVSHPKKPHTNKETGSGPIKVKGKKSDSFSGSSFHSSPSAASLPKPSFGCKLKQPDAGVEQAQAQAQQLQQQQQQQQQSLDAMQMQLEQMRLFEQQRMQGVPMKPSFQMNPMQQPMYFPKYPPQQFMGMINMFPMPVMPGYMPQMAPPAQQMIPQSADGIH